MKTRWRIAVGFVLLVALVVFGLPVVQMERDTKRFTVSQNNLKQIGVGLHNYDDVYGMMPLGADSGADGTPHHGWQIRVLPFLEATPLYSAIDFKYPWNDPFNAPCFRFRVLVWLVPGIERTTDDNGFALSHYAGSSHIFRGDYGASIGTMRGGGSQTILVGEITDGFMPWGRPGNWRDPVAGINGGDRAFGSHHPAGVQFVMGDGSVRAIERGVDPQVLKALATPVADDLSSDR